jgi:hypothetical protein
MDAGRLLPQRFAHELEAQYAIPLNRIIRTEQRALRQISVSLLPAESPDARISEARELAGRILKRVDVRTSSGEGAFPPLSLTPCLSFRASEPERPTQSDPWNTMLTAFQEQEFQSGFMSFAKRLMKTNETSRRENGARPKILINDPCRDGVLHLLGRLAHNAALPLTLAKMDGEWIFCGDSGSAPAFQCHHVTVPESILRDMDVLIPPRRVLPGETPEHWPRLFGDWPVKLWGADLTRSTCPPALSHILRSGKEIENGMNREEERIGLVSRGGAFFGQELSRLRTLLERKREWEKRTGFSLHCFIYDNYDVRYTLLFQAMSDGIGADASLTQWWEQKELSFSPPFTEAAISALSRAKDAGDAG